MIGSINYRGLLKDFSLPCLLSTLGPDVILNTKIHKKTLMQSIQYTAKIVFIWVLFYRRSFEEQQAHWPHLLTWVNRYKSLSMHFSLLVVMFLPNYPSGCHSNQSNSVFCRGLLKQPVYKTFVNIQISPRKTLFFAFHCGTPLARNKNHLFRRGFSQRNFVEKLRESSRSSGETPRNFALGR